jgi:flagellar motor switch protein FliG
VQAASRASPAEAPTFRLPGKMPTLAAGEDLAREHPAVIAHILRPEAQDVRVAVLRALPGQLARDVMRRLKTP